MRLGLAVTSLDLRYGGPAVSVPALAEALQLAGVNVRIWDDAAQYRVRRREFDIIHDNGLWLRSHHDIALACARLGIARVASPRGMLAPWARRHKRFKKTLAWHLYQRQDLDTAQVVHCTSEAEVCDLSGLGVRAPLRCIPNGLEFHGVPDRASVKSSETLECVFLGRLYPVKGLPNLIEAWRRVRPKGWVLTLIGPDEAGHHAELERQVAEAGLEDVVTFEPEVRGAAKYERLARADLFVLPSYTESFGMSVAEALAVGLPVITTTSTPWIAVQKNEMGWVVQPDVVAIEQALRVATSLDSHSLRAIGSHGPKYITDNFGWKSLVPRYLEMYDAAIFAASRLRT